MADGTLRNLRSFDERSKKQRGMEWAFLKGCFDYQVGNETRSIMPSDMDGYVERCGRFLFFEEKHPHEKVEVGQRIALNHLVEQGHTVFIIWGDTREPFIDSMAIWKPRSPEDCESRLPFPATITTLREKCIIWFEWANKQRRRT